MTDVKNLEPQVVWEIFAGLSEVPRPSKREEKVRVFIHSFAQKHGLSSAQDDAGNIVIQVPATPGHEHSAKVVLQGHFDMVCEKNSDVEHDFDHDPIQLLIDSDDSGAAIVHAAGTTLGADNGIGVALAMAAAISDDLVHGPLELLLTTDEEQGMTGAMALTPNSFDGRILINLDSEEDNALYIGCAGGVDINMEWQLHQVPPMEPLAYQLKLSGLRGGHSGCDIHENRGNAIQLMARLLMECGEFELAEFSGGNLRNAIPRESTAWVVGDATLGDRLEQAAARVEAAARGESFENNINIEITDSKPPTAGVVTAVDSRNLVQALVAIPSGVISMHPQVAGLVQNSNNLSTLTMSSSDGQVSYQVGCLSRSATASCLNLNRSKLSAIALASGAKVEHGNQYNGWEPNLDSGLLKTCQQVYQDCFGKEAHVAAIHAGLECGIIGDRVGGTADMISFGPRIEGAHSPDERVWVDSVAKIWSYLRAVLAELARDGDGR